MNDSYPEYSPHDLLSDLDASELLENREKLQLFSCACCRLIFDKLPPVAQTALNVGEDFSKGLVSPERLEAERIKLWTVLGNESCNFESPYVNAMRAVICCLFDQTEAGLEYDSASIVMEFCNAVEEHEREQYELLRQVFLGSDISL